ncbi:hypothetical protein A3I18_01535 [Candidatus Campbellbacteria bacterium RIFCSPLOWO2_02_FULL_35_11]|uniref:Phosphoribosyltransferase domain-containing protein n=2 Tax=Candidatus Campbelliibacteriota TaxID=1752727 RepID=A0A1F5EN18_9BACT|nr:MAG: hypothetical protein A3E89_00740 [Candidatus Campbellbacteria bacterium RIFCSPHIGHO2_12_FULL_35_10]OGD70457.1 MAG: hypothetical protein A3I18_01535 [Candidatus Campbellbacteria bacterium RIFCSPLOWO2_02_FULL_35_11]
MKNHSKKIFVFLLDILFPRNAIQKELDNISTEEFLKRANKTSHADKNIITIFDYKNKLIREAIWSLKFRRNTRLAKIFAQIIYDEIMEDLSDMETFENFKNPILVPMPISAKRRRERGFNQCELIANELTNLNSEMFVLNKKSLIKIKDTPPQSRMKNKKDRLENLKDCFAVRNKELIKGKNIILLDDVTTTGTTLKEARKVLRRHGAKKIICVTVAH